MSITGVEAILRKLGSVKRAIDTGVFVNAVEEWARVEFIPRAQAYAPVSTGELRDSIGFETTADQVFVFAGAAHASHVEFGTFKMAAKPFIRPAYKAARPLLSRYTRRKLREVMK